MTAPRPNRLTCEAALERLDAAWLDPLPDEPLDVELQAAREHLQECSACWAEWERRVAADRRIAEVMQAVPVPSALREQLLAQARVLKPAAAAVSEVPPERASRLHQNSLRRRAWWISVVAMLLVSTAGGTWLWQFLSPSRVTLQALCDQTPMDPTHLLPVSDLTRFPPLPANWPRTKGLRIVGTPCWFTPAKSREAAGWIAFEFRSGARPPISGVLLVTRQTTVSDPPPSMLVRPTWRRYTTRAGKPVSVAGWSEYGYVYLCFVPGASSALDRVIDATAPTPA